MKKSIFSSLIGKLQDCRGYQLGANQNRRPTDVQLIANAPVPLTNIPTTITSFFNASQASTESSAQPPVSLEIEGEVYHLEADEYIEEITQIEEGIVIKSVKATELNGSTIAYSEVRHVDQQIIVDPKLTARL